MADFSALKTSIQNYIKKNGNEEITGNLLQQILLSMVSTLGDSAINDLVTALNAEIANRGNADTELGGNITTLQGVVNGIKANVENGYVYAGIATPSATPVSGKVFYLALTAGTYTNFGATVVPQGINILKYNGSVWSLDSFLGLDDAPTQGSDNLVKSGGVLDSIIKDGSAFDLSAYNNGTTYADLSAALTALNALPAAYKKSGMSFKFVLSSDNKYVQYMLAKNEWSASEADWEKVSPLSQDIKNALNIKGIFSRESDFSTYNGVRIYDIFASKLVPNTYEVGLCYIGVFGDGEHIEILLTKDCLSSKDYENYLAELYLPIQDINTQDEIQTLTIPAKNPSLYGNIEYYITLNIHDLLTINGLDNNKIYFDKDYINRRCKERYYLKSVVIKGNSNWNCLKEFNIYIPYTDTNEYYLSQFGLLQGGYFIVGFKHIGSDELLYAQTKANFTIPSRGVSKIPFDLYFIDNTPVYGYKFDITIDWSSYNDPLVIQNTNSGIIVSPIIKDIAEIVEGGTISGNFVLSEDIVIKKGIHLYGNDCSIKLNGHTITLNDGAGLHNIKFYDDWDISRTIDLTKESGFAPSLTLNDIKGVLSDDSPLGTPSIIIDTASQNTQVDGCTFYQIGGIAVKALSGAHRSNQQPLISNCYFNECKCGLYIHGEFIKVINSTFDNNYFGIYIDAGNSNICNCIYKRCDCGILMKGGGNGMHGQMSNIEVAHCMVVGLFVRDTSVNLGYVFNSCQFADASIESDECHSLMFSGCRMETWFKIDSGSKNSIHNSIFSKAYANMYQVPFLDFPSDTSLMGNRGIRDCTDAEVNNNVL